MHRYVLAEEVGFGAALVTDSTYGFDVTRDVRQDGAATDVTTTLRLSLLRAPRFPDPETDQGEQHHRYGLVIGADLDAATREGYTLNTDRRVQGGHPVAPVAIASAGLVISAVKLAADRSGDLIVRLYEPHGRRASGTLQFARPVAAVREASLIEDPLGGAVVEGGDTVRVSLTPFEVRTYRVAL
jgi:alpha-mannosidase